MSNASLILSFLAVVAAAVTSPANACSPLRAEMTDENIARALQEADSVVVARVISVKQSSAPGDRGGAFLIEQAALDVIEVIKGPHKIGDTIQIRSTLGPGPCGKSVRNDPPWIFEVPEQGDMPDRPVPLSDTWLVYGTGEQPYALDLGYSTPMNVGGEAQLEKLHRLSQQTR